MRKTFVFLFISACLIVPVVYADNYPKNLAIDIQHYQFKLWLSDKHDSIRAETTVILHFKKAGIQLVRLDLSNATSELQGKGMTVASVTCNDK